jgi:UDP-N-acetyl-D-glucosamine/UDP-N-acetyl-D-galactosamine dehydrogenase
MYNELIEKKKKLAVIGLGYVGLPIALLFARKISVIGFDINAQRVEMLKNNQDPSGELEAHEFEGCDISFTANVDDLKEAHFFVVGVPTPIDQHNNPELKPLVSASEFLSRVLKPGDYVVYESTVYPGCTEEDCIPILERSGLKFKTDFKVGYSPERINPGDKERTLATTAKIVSGCDEESLEEIYKVYQLAITAPLHKAPTIKVAEAAKVIENTQRDLNIALMNELSLIFSHMGINTYDVLEAAATKWNFQHFKPGLVGGHCIGVDPYYLTYKATELGYNPKVILAGRAINDGMGAYIGSSIVKELIARNKDISASRVLILGCTFKENVMDIRNSKIFDLVRELRSFSVNVDIVDARADKGEVLHEYNVELADAPTGKYDALVLAVTHDEYLNHPESWFLELANLPAILFDLKGVYRGQLKELSYWSL